VIAAPLPAGPGGAILQAPERGKPRRISLGGSMRIIVMAAIAMLVAGPAYAQKKTDDEKKRDAQIEAVNERAYRSSLGNIPEQNVTVDPWGNMRGTPATNTGRASSGNKPRQQ
jgi:hypothetical protein